MIQFETCVSNGLVQPPTRCVLSVVCNGDMVRNSDPSLNSQDLALWDSMSFGDTRVLRLMVIPSFQQTKNYLMHEPWSWKVGKLNPYGYFPKIGVSQNGWFVMENPLKMDDLGITLFLETPMLKLTILGTYDQHFTQFSMAIAGQLDPEWSAIVLAKHLQDLHW